MHCLKPILVKLVHSRDWAENAIPNTLAENYMKWLHDKIHGHLKSWHPADVHRLYRRTLAGGLDIQSGTHVIGTRIF